MGDLSEIAWTDQQSVTIEVPPFWQDHRFQGRAVLPAVEAMQLLAGWAAQIRPGLRLTEMANARFDKFLALAPETSRLEAYCRLSGLADGRVRAALVTRTQAKSAAFTRVKEHVAVDFLPPGSPTPAPALDMAAALEGICYSVEPTRIYQDLVPFGPAFRSIHEPLQLSADGALARLRTPDAAPGDACGPLGSPFPLDGAFHAACVWSQRYASIVAFPVGIARRRVYQSTQPGQSYVGRVVPVRRTPEELIFDIWILDQEGRIGEAALGVRMRDVSGGRLAPPAWIESDLAGGVLADLEVRCDGLALIELDHLMPFGALALSPHEAARFAKMGPGRRISYLGARLACKRLWRRLAGDNGETDARQIETVDADQQRPCCPPTPQGGAPICAVSHDRRFAVAVAGPDPLGVDVEKEAPRLAKAWHIYMHPAEQILARQSELGRVAAAVRIWSIKEAVAKAADLDLADAWYQTEVTVIGDRESRFRLQNHLQAKAFHQCVEGHVFTLVSGMKS